jgi:hypothetical protein
MYNIIMKFSNTTLLAIILCTIIFGMLGRTVVEGLENQHNKDQEGRHHHLPRGITRDKIPRGEEDKYILKSEIVPPVCPACPQSAACPREKKCQPCPPCGRCPEPSFECKKVPNYQSNNEQYLPKPMLNSFSSF